MSLVLLFRFPSFIHMMLIFCHQRGDLWGSWMSLSFNVNLIKLEFLRCCWLPFSFVYLKFIEQLIWYKIEFHYLTAIFIFLAWSKFSKTTNQKWWKIMVLWYGRRRENVQKSRQNFYEEILEIPRQATWQRMSSSGHGASISFQFRHHSLIPIKNDAPFEPRRFLIHQLIPSRKISVEMKTIPVKEFLFDSLKN